MKMWKITIYKIPVQGGKKVAQHFEAGKLLLQVSSIDLLPLLPPVVSLKASSKTRKVMKHVSWFNHHEDDYGGCLGREKKTLRKSTMKAMQSCKVNQRLMKFLPVHQVLHPIKNRLSGMMMWAPRNSREKWGQCQWRAWKLHDFRHLNFKFRYPRSHYPIIFFKSVNFQDLLRKAWSIFIEAEAAST